jgi:hypothetical protein
VWHIDMLALAIGAVGHLAVLGDRAFQPLTSRVRCGPITPIATPAPRIKPDNSTDDETKHRSHFPF